MLLIPGNEQEVLAPPHCQAPIDDLTIYNIEIMIHGETVIDHKSMRLEHLTQNSCFSLYTDPMRSKAL